MSEIIWRNVAIPEDCHSEEICFPAYFSDLIVKNVKKIPLDDNKLVELPDRRSFRTLNRVGLLLAAAALPAKNVLEPYQVDEIFKVGLYGAVNQGPESYECAASTLDIDENDFAGIYKKKVSPKHYLKMLPNLAVAQIGMFLNIVGPTSVFVHHEASNVQALSQAEFDLENGIVNVALVCSSFSCFEDPVLLASIRRELSEEVTLCEGAGALIMLPNGSYVDWDTKWESMAQKNGSVNYGIADYIVKLAIKGRHRCL